MFISIHGLPSNLPLFHSYFQRGCVLVTHSCPNLCSPMHCSPPGSSVLEFPKNLEMCCRSFLQGILLTQKLNVHCLNWQVESLPLSHQGSPFRRDNPLQFTHQTLDFSKPLHVLLLCLLPRLLPTHCGCCVSLPRSTCSTSQGRGFLRCNPHGAPSSLRPPPDRSVTT